MMESSPDQNIIALIVTPLSLFCPSVTVTNQIDSKLQVVNHDWGATSDLRVLIVIQSDGSPVRRTQGSHNPSHPEAGGWEHSQRDQLSIS